MGREELRRANENLQLATEFFAQAELDRRFAASEHARPSPKNRPHIRWTGSTVSSRLTGRTVFNAISKVVAEGESVHLIGFGSFGAGKRARIDRLLRTLQRHFLLEGPILFFVEGADDRLRNATGSKNDRTQRGARADIADL